MIPPVGPGQWPALRNELPLPGQGDDAGGSAADDGFARLLAQLAGARDPGSFLGAAESTAAVGGGAPAAVAEIFNEHGLLGGGPDATSCSPTVQPLGGSSAHESFPLSTSASAVVPPAGTRLSDAASAPTLGVVQTGAFPTAPGRGLKAAAAAAAAHRLAPAVPAASPRPGETALRLVDGEANMAEALGSGARLSEPREGSKSGARLRLEQTAEGLRVIAQASGLDREERVRLRARIGQLLAHLGFSAAQVRLNGDEGRRESCK